MSANGKPLRVAVIGSGPAGFYAAGALLGADLPVEVDLFERLPTPWGLVRLGVAPDHPKIKTVSRAFEKTAERPGFRFLGNVEVGRDLSHDELLRLYDAVVYTVGAQTDRRMGIPGEDLPGSWPATEFVAWYNGHPDFQDLTFDLSGERVVVVGAGNVAVDVARMLALTEEELRCTDTTDAAIEAILGSNITRDRDARPARAGPGSVHDPGARGARRAGGRRRDRRSRRPRARSREPGASSRATPTAGRNLEVMREYAARAPSGKPKTLRLRFCVSPVAILGEEKVEAVEIVRNELVADESGRVKAVATDEREVLPCGLVLRSVGYRGAPVGGAPFDERSGTIPNEGGRIVDDAGAPIAGAYCAGWIKRGPSGVIGTNKKCATETVELLLEDAREGRLPKPETDDPGRVLELLAERGVEVVTYDGWRAIDELECARGEEQGRPRVKLCTWDELLAAARGVPAA